MEGVRVLNLPFTGSVPAALVIAEV